MSRDAITDRHGLSRRDLLKTLPLAAIAASCGRTPLPYRREDFVVPPRSPMALLPA